MPAMILDVGGSAVDLALLSQLTSAPRSDAFGSQTMEVSC